jgi:type IV secretory pathway component VirB8
MDIAAILLSMAGKFPWLMLILSILGALVVLGQAIVAMTPSKADDAVLDQVEKNGFFKMVLDALASFAPIQKK